MRVNTSAISPEAIFFGYWRAFLGGRKTKAQPTLELLFCLNLLGIDDQHQVYVLPRGNRLLATGEVGGGGYDLNDGQKSSWHHGISRRARKAESG